MAKHLRGLPEELLAWFAPNGYTFLTDFLQRNSNLISTVESYIVLKTSTRIGAQELSGSSTNQNREEKMEVDEAQVEFPNVNLPSAPQPEQRTSETLPNIVNGSQPWHNQVPADWVPIITSDVQQQKKQNSQAPFSDAYLLGMPSKRRKIVHNSKVLHGIPLPQVISESMRKAVSNIGLAREAPLDLVCSIVGGSKDVQEAYRKLLRTSVQERLRNNSDFDPERFPNTARYFLPE